MKHVIAVLFLVIALFSFQKRLNVQTELVKNFVETTEIEGCK